MKTGRNRIAELERKFRLLAAENERIREENRELREENRKLRERVDYLVRQLFGRKSEKVDPRQLLLMLEGLEAAEPEEPEPEPPPEDPSPRPKRKRRKMQDRLPEDLPVRTVIIDPPEVKRNPEAYRCIGEEVRTELSLTQPVYFIRKIVRRKYVSKEDRKQPPVIAPAPPSLIANSFASTELLIEILLKKYVEHLPLYRQAQTLKRQYGIELSRKTMSRWMRYVGDWLQTTYEGIGEAIRESGYMQVDETGIRYLDPDTDHARTGFLWTAVAKGCGVYYDWHTSRSAECLDKMLKGYTGDLQCDGYSAYRTHNRSRAKKDRYGIFACWAHVRRKFFEAKDDSELAARTLSRIQALYRIEASLRESGAGPAERKRRRREESREILREIRKDLVEGLGAYRPQSLTGRAIQYTLGLWDELVRYAETGHVEIDNNRVENAIRPTAVGKKNWLFFGSPESGRESAIIYSIVETCRMLDINPREYLEDVLPKLPTMTAREARELTPAKWLEKRTSAVA